MASVLLVEDKASLRSMLATAIEGAGHAVTQSGDGGQAVDLVRQRPFHLVVTDLRLPTRSGIEILKAQREVDPSIPVLIMTAYGTVEDAVEAMKLGAFDFVPKPVDISHLLLLVDRALERRRLVIENTLLKEEFQSTHGVPRIVAESDAIKEVGRQVEQVAPTDATVLLTGESGTGKQVFAHAIHRLSSRRECPFVTVNCAAIPETLIENELFGHEKGAYTGAIGRKIGKFELADGGTIFLDEIGELGIAVQAKVLRIIEEQEFERIGGLESIRVNARIVAATNRDLQRLVSEKLFREDLFFRLSVFPIRIPPLRSRPGDIGLLARFFLKKFAADLHRPVMDLTPEAERRLEEYSWPGNVRELQNSIERAVILSEGNRLQPDDLSFAFGADRLDGLTEQLDLSGSLSEVTERVTRLAETAKIRQALELADRNKTKAAELLGVSYKTLLNKIKQYGLE